jgi:outer membrane protein
MINKNWWSLFTASCFSVFLIFAGSKSALAIEDSADLQATNNIPSLTLDAPLDLDQAVNLALERNPDLHIANKRIAIAEAQVGESLASFYPQIKGRVSYVYSDNPAQVFGMIVAQRDFTQQDFLNINNPGGRTNFRPEVIGNLSLYRGGQDYQRYKIAQLGVEISALERSAILNNLIQIVTDNYYVLLVSKENRIIAIRSKDAVAQELKNTEIRFHEGTVLKSDVLSLQVRLASARESLIRATNVIEMAKMGLRTILDLTLSSPVETVNLSEDNLPDLPDSIADLQSLAAANRPEIQIANKLLSTRQRQVKVAQGEHLPRIDAFVNYGMDSEDGSFSSNLDNVTTGVALEMDIFSGFGSQQRVRQAERRLEEARQNAHKVKLQINQEVKNTYLAFTDALQRFKVADASVKAAAEAFRLVTVQYQTGTASVTRYIEAEVARDQADARTIAARYDTFRANAALKRVIGEWK